MRPGDTARLTTPGHKDVPDDYPLYVLRVDAVAGITTVMFTDRKGCTRTKRFPSSALEARANVTQPR